MNNKTPDKSNITDIFLICCSVVLHFVMKQSVSTGEWFYTVSAALTFTFLSYSIKRVSYPIVRLSNPIMRLSYQVFCLSYRENLLAGFEFIVYKVLRL